MPMSPEIAIEVVDLGKCYPIYDKPRDRLLQMLAPGRRKYFREFWALKNVSFEVGRGETVGIVGANGSGKSTLLQLVCGILGPTSGSVKVNGRVSALLELGSGFNLEFSGRENVHLGCAVLGLAKDEVEARYGEIAAFADIGDFLDQPVKTYSSGMLLRLAFAVAVSVDPRILVVDEALAVGDELFQRKCFSRIDALRGAGATILFVSHSGTAIIELCDRAILLDGGELLAAGTPKGIVGKYQKLLYAPQHSRPGIRQAIRSDMAHGGIDTPSLSGFGIALGRKANSPAGEQKEFFDPALVGPDAIAYESRGVTIDSPMITGGAGERLNCLRRGGAYSYTYAVTFAVGATNVRFGMLVRTLSGYELGGATSAPSADAAIPYVGPGARVEVRFRFQCSLSAGTYLVNAGVLGAEGAADTYLHRILDACVFRVLPERETLVTGTVDFNCIPEITLVSGPAAPAPG